MLNDTVAQPPFAVSERDCELAEQWWSDNLEEPATNEDFSALWILCSLFAMARFEGPRDPSPGYKSKWRGDVQMPTEQTTEEGRCDCGGRLIFDDGAGTAYCPSCKSIEKYIPPRAEGCAGELDPAQRRGSSAPLSREEEAVQQGPSASLPTDWDLLMSLRGGHPEKCDFCDQPYGGGRWPVPEEAGAWACNECLERWEKQDAT